jgi:ADP-ribose pyrophosphatase YjhB (NUDIX family)
MDQGQVKWVKWAHALAATAQNGLHFSKDGFDIERYKAIQQIAVEILSEYTDLSKEKIRELFSYEKGYVTPRVDVRGALVVHHKILLVKERSDGLWSLPGGWADVNESPSEAAVREMKEESGFDVRVVKLIALYDKQKHPHPIQLPHTYKVFFLCEAISDQEFRAGMETTDLGFFHYENLPGLSLNRVTPEQIASCFAHAKNCNLPADFD